jgi:hypothetical protein
VAFLKSTSFSSFVKVLASSVFMLETTENIPNPPWFGRREYFVHSWWIDPAFPAGGECWDRLAKWPDGKPFDQWDCLF